MRKANGCKTSCPREQPPILKGFGNEHTKKKFNIEVENMKAVCPLGEVIGAKMIDENKIPVISCEGAAFVAKLQGWLLTLLESTNPLCVAAMEKCLHHLNQLWQAGPKRLKRL